MKAPDCEMFEDWYSWVGGVGGNYRFNVFAAKLTVPLFLLLSVKYIPRESEAVTFYGGTGFLAGLSILFILGRLHGRLLFIWRSEAQKHGNKWLEAQRAWFNGLACDDQSAVQNEWCEMASAARQELRESLARYSNQLLVRLFKLEPRKHGHKGRRLCGSDFNMREYDAEKCNTELFREYLRFRALEEVSSLPVTDE